MKTDSLIRALAADTAVDRPSPLVASAGLLLAFGMTVLLLKLALGFRADLATASGNPVSVLRFGLTGAPALVAGRLALMPARPEGPTLRGFGLWHWWHWPPLARFFGPQPTQRLTVGRWRLLARRRSPA